MVCPMPAEIQAVLPYYKSLEKRLSTKNTAFLLAAVIKCKKFPIFDLEHILWLRPLHTAKNLCPTLFHTATVKPKRRGRSLLYRTPLICRYSVSVYILGYL